MIAAVTDDLPQRLALGATGAGAVALMIGAAGPWGQAGSYTATGLTGASDEGAQLYPGLDDIGGLPAFAILVAGAVVLAAISSYVLRGARSALIAAAAAAALGLVFAVVGLLGVTGADVGFGGADPVWGIIAALAGGVLATGGSVALLARRRNPPV